MDLKKMLAGLDKIPYVRALIKHDIKSLEIKIKHAFNLGLTKDEFGELLEQVCYKYHSLHCLLNVGNAGTLAQAKSIADEYPIDIKEVLLFWNSVESQAIGLETTEEALQKYRAQLASSHRVDEQLDSIKQILRCYLRLYQSLKTQPVSYQKPEFSPSHSVELACFDFMLKPDVASCLAGVIHLFELSAKQYVNYQAFSQAWQKSAVFRDSGQEIRAYLDFFSDPLIVTLNLQLRLSYSDSSALFSAATHSLKLISVHNRVESLHLALTQLYCFFRGLASLREQSINRDWLMPHTSLPDGVATQLLDEYKAYILHAVKRVNALAYPNDQFYQQKYHEMISSFIFWFNPVRFIDTVLAIKERMSGPEKLSHGDESIAAVTLFFQQRYRKLTAQECINLYGYFSNKVLNYLMQMLKKSGESMTFDWLKPLSDSEKALLLFVYRLCEQILQALREELSRRSIHTEEFAFVQAKKRFKPRNRIKRCIEHILLVYGGRKIPPNTELESLFERLE